ncbi:MAG: hypothetical protein V2B19_11930 [Pseudomonadota bacterium]
MKKEVTQPELNVVIELSTSRNQTPECGSGIGTNHQEEGNVHG